MKKSVVALLVVLALVVLISPGIIGRLAEKSVDDNLNWAVSESEQVIVTSTGFDRGWFTSEGQHRVELRDEVLPALIIDTRLDHGLIPVSSMARAHGSLMPGLGSAVSALRLERADGSVVDLPGTIFSSVGITGELESNFVLEPDGIEVDGARFDWGTADFVVTTNPANGDIGVDGDLSSLAIASDGKTIMVDTLSVSVDHAATPFGFTVGAAKVTLKSVAVIGTADTANIGPIYMDSDSAIDDGRLDAEVSFRIKNAPLPKIGSASMEIVARLENVEFRAG